MRPVSKMWFETIVRYDKTVDDGQQKKVTETYVVDALSFGEAEELITKELSHYISGEFEVKNINPAPYPEIFFSDDSSDDKYFKVVLSFITIDEKTEKEKRSNVVYLVQASTTRKAEDNTKKVMETTMNNYEVKDIKSSPVLDVFEHKAEAKSDEAANS